MDKSEKRRLVENTKSASSVGAPLPRYAPTGEVWVSSSPNLDAQQNSTWFGLRLGSHPNRALQAAWKEHGEDAFTYDIFEVLPDEDRSAYALKADLKALADRWRQDLGARPVTG